MFRVLLIALLTIAGACAQNAGPPGGEAAPEPFSYSYETETHSAGEQKDQNGRVTGYYTLTDAADGRARRVEYYADETGFHAKVQTNEVGTESKNSADVEVFASPPTREQLSYQPPVSQPQPPRFAVAQQAAAVATSQPARAQTASYGQQAGYAYNSYGSPGYGQYGYSSPSGYNSQYNYANYPGYGYGSGAYGAYGGYGGASNQYGGASSQYGAQYPASYYKSVQGSSVTVQPSSYSSSSSFGAQPYTTGGVAKYTVSSPVVGAAGATGSSYKSSTTYQAVGVPPSGVGYQTSFVGPQRTSYSRVNSGYSSSSAPVGSSNYIVLKKRDVEDEV